MAKKFLELFSKYTPSPSDKQFLEDAEVVKTLVDRDARIVNATVFFPRYVRQTDLSRIADEVKEAHGINGVMNYAALVAVYIADGNICLCFHFVSDPPVAFISLHC